MPRTRRLPTYIAKINLAEQAFLHALGDIDRAISEVDALTRSKNNRAVQCSLQKLTLFYSLRKDFAAADHAYASWEKAAEDPIFVMAEKSFYLFAVKKDISGALAATRALEDRMPSRPTDSQKRSFYRALNIRGRAQIELNQHRPAASTMSRVVRLIESNPSVRFAYELDFAEELACTGVGTKSIHKYLELAHWESDVDGWRKRANRLKRRLRKE